MARGKERTYEQAEAAQRKAVRFLRDVVGDPDKADEFESLSVAEYADHKGFVLSNPAPTTNPTQRRTEMSEIFYQNPATGVNEAVELSSLSHDDLLDHAERLANRIGQWEDMAHAIGDAVIDFEDDKLNGQQLADEVWAALVEVAPDEFDADESDKGERAA